MLQKLAPICLAVSLCITMQSVSSAEQAPPSAFEEREIDLLVTSAMQTFDVPGIAVGILENGNVTHLKGYGILSVDEQRPITAETLFGIASNSKAFTSTALALLVDKGQLSWDDRVADYIPEFELYDPWVTNEFTILDLLIHNSGLGLGAGDLMIWPAPSFSKDEIIQNIRHLKPVSSFRSEFAYDNLFYIVAGEVVSRVSGQSYEDFVEDHILTPLEMVNCAADREKLNERMNIATPHIVMDGVISTTSRYQSIDERTVVSAAGGIQCSAEDMLKWLHMFLDGGAAPDGSEFLSSDQTSFLTSQKTIMGVYDQFHDWFGTEFSSYGVGWFLADAFGEKWAYHTGGLRGMVSFVSILPESDTGIVVLTNQQSSPAMGAIMYQLIETATTAQSRDWVSLYEDRNAKRESEIAEAALDYTAIQFTPTTALSVYKGVYQDNWIGNVLIDHENEQLTIRFDRVAPLSGSLIPHKDNLFIAKWDDRTLEADAFVKFETDFDGAPSGFTMRAVSVFTDFSFDFQDLEFSKVTSSEVPE